MCASYDVCSVGGPVSFDSRPGAVILSLTIRSAISPTIHVRVCFYRDHYNVTAIGSMSDQYLRRRARSVPRPLAVVRDRRLPPRRELLIPGGLRRSRKAEHRDGDVAALLQAQVRERERERERETCLNPKHTRIL